MGIRFWRGLYEAGKFLASLFTTCAHKNTNYVTPWLKSCWDCGRVRRIDELGRRSVWHKEGSNA